MKERHQHVGHVADPTGESLLDFHLRRRANVQFALQGVDESVSGNVSCPRPYSATLCSPEILEVSLVTPGDPSEDRFSRWAYEICTQACLGNR